MSSRLKLSALVGVTLSLAFGSATEALAAPKVVKVGPDHYRGTWLEIGRTPMFLTDRCVAGYSTYRKGRSPDEVIVEDGCHTDTPNGRLKTVNGTGKIEDFGTTNAKMRVRYPLFITFNYWVIYKSSDKSWFISTNPSMTDLWIYSRTVPSKSRLERMVLKASQLGYDVRKLEFPAQ
jgi:apolipoprotein D and lipocalin family protein